MTAPSAHASREEDLFYRGDINTVEFIINNERKLHSVDELLELPPGTLTGSEQLGQLAAWDSVAVISFLAMADERFNISIQAQDIAKCKTVADLIALLP